MDKLDKELYGDVLWRIYGPYPRKDGRKHIVLYFGDGIKRTLSYPKYLMERHLGRLLKDDETVDHIDNNFINDDLHNLQVLSLADNAAKAIRPAERILVQCANCNKEFEVYKKYYEYMTTVRGQKKWYCNAKCVGIY